ncbi:MAG: phosphatase PAP2 family protein, partial [Candidatus Diapherotrites archaeon]|nr:phosphatase PAP2 family protein [Candidatus Diapherotrites archaeon]
LAALIYWQGHENRSFFLMNLVLFSSAVVGALKFAIARERPSSDFFKVLASDASSPAFPSGHATIAAGFFSYAYTFVKTKTRAFFAVMVAAVAFSRLYLGMHFPSDVIAGIALGLVLGKANLLARNRLFHKEFRPSKLEDELALVGLVILAVIAIMFLRSLPMSGIFIGFYAGFFLFKEMRLQQRKLKSKMLAAKFLIGFALLAPLFLVGENIVSIGIALDELQRFALYCLSGFWISWLWPAIFEKALSRKKQ